MLPRVLALILYASASTVVAQSAPAPQQSSSSTIAVTFWNVQWFPGRRPNASRAEEDRQIRSVHHDLTQLAPDLIGLEEVRDSEHATVAVKPLAGFKVDVCSNFPPREGQKEAQQVAIASRLQPLSAWAESWKPGAAITPPRGFAFAAYQLAPRKALLVYALHLKSNRGEIHEDMRIREESMRQLRSHMKAMNNAYATMGALTWIVGGDFNTAPDDPRFAGEKTVPYLLADGFAWVWQGIPFASRITVPADARYPAASFDHIFYRGAILSKAWGAETSPQSSDHRAVNVVLRFQ
jgi:endonuclease/exonuclease/phosphatase family metal-dependent hydrolase